MGVEALINTHEYYQIPDLDFVPMESQQPLSPFPLNPCYMDALAVYYGGLHHFVKQFVIETTILHLTYKHNMVACCTQEHSDFYTNASSLQLVY